VQNLPLSRPWTDTSVGSTVAAASTSAAVEGPVPPDQIRLLALPSPTEILGPDERSWRAWASWRLWTQFIMETVVGVSDRRKRKKRRQSRTSGAVNANPLARRRSGGMGMRIVRSSLLVVKVLSISRLCVDPTTRPRPVVAALLLAVAVVDPVIDHDEVVGVGHEREEGERSAEAVDELGWKEGGWCLDYGWAGAVPCWCVGSQCASDGASWEWWGRVCCIPMNGGYRSVSTPV
jgi:hypothetical protein